MSENRTPGAKKGQPTPSRKEQEQARIRPLVGDRSKEAKQAERNRIREERTKAREGMMAGDERYLTLRDRGPQRKYVRDLVDARFTGGNGLGIGRAVGVAAARALGLGQGSVDAPGERIHGREYTGARRPFTRLFAIRRAGSWPCGLERLWGPLSCWQRAQPLWSRPSW